MSLASVQMLPSDLKNNRCCWRCLRVQCILHKWHTHSWQCLQPVDVDMGHNGVDLTTKSGQAEVSEVITEQSSDLISWAPPCGPYSPLQNIIPRNPTKRQLKWFRLLKKRKYASRLWKFCRHHSKEGMKQHKQFAGDGKSFHVVENAEKSAAWSELKFPEWASGPHDQCRFGLRIQKQDKLGVKKPTGLQCTDPRLVPNLTATCRCHEA